MGQLKAKRLLTDEEFDKFLKLREESSVKAARYMKSLEKDLYEVTDEKYGNRNNVGDRDSQVTES